MPYFTLFGPLFDIALISIVFNIVAYIAYGILYKREFAKIASVDIRLSIAEILFVIANYAPTGVTVAVPYLGETSWWLWYIIVSIPIEIVFFVAYKYYFKLEWHEIAGSARKE